MTRLEKYLTTTTDHANDVIILWGSIPQLNLVPATLIEKMYRDYSEMWAAGWVSGPDVEGFRNWLLGEV